MLELVIVVNLIIIIISRIVNRNFTQLLINNIFWFNPTSVINLEEEEIIIIIVFILKKTNVREQ